MKAALICMAMGLGREAGAFPTPKPINCILRDCPLNQSTSKNLLPYVDVVKEHFSSFWSVGNFYPFPRQEENSNSFGSVDKSDSPKFEQYPRLLLNTIRSAFTPQCRRESIWSDYFMDHLTDYISETSERRSSIPVPLFYDDKTYSPRQKRRQYSEIVRKLQDSIRSKLYDGTAGAMWKVNYTSLVANYSSSRNDKSHRSEEVPWFYRRFNSQQSNPPSHVHGPVQEKEREREPKDVDPEAAHINEWFHPMTADAGTQTEPDTEGTIGPHAEKSSAAVHAASRDAAKQQLIPHADSVHAAAAMSDLLLQTERTPTAAAVRLETDEPTATITSGLTEPVSIESSGAAGGELPRTPSFHPVVLLQQQPQPSTREPFPSASRQEASPTAAADALLLKVKPDLASVPDTLSRDTDPVTGDRRVFGKRFGCASCPVSGPTPAPLDLPASIPYSLKESPNWKTRINTHPFPIVSKAKVQLDVFELKAKPEAREEDSGSSCWCLLSVMKAVWHALILLWRIIWVPPLLLFTAVLLAQWASVAMVMLRQRLRHGHGHLLWAMLTGMRVCGNDQSGYDSEAEVEMLAEASLRPISSPYPMFDATDSGKWAANAFTSLTGVDLCAAIPFDAIGRGYDHDPTADDSEEDENDSGGAVGASPTSEETSAAASAGSASQPVVMYSAVPGVVPRMHLSPISEDEDEDWETLEHEDANEENGQVGSSFAAQAAEKQTPTPALARDGGAVAAVLQVEALRTEEETEKSAVAAATVVGGYE